MSRGLRAALLAALAVVVAVVAFVALRPDDEEGEGAGERTTPRTTTAPEARPKPKPKRVVLKAGAPVGGIAKLSFKKGERVRFAITSDTPDRVHVHGYDIEKAVSPGKPTGFSFPARIEGVFEVEVHSSHQPVAELEVEP